MPLLPAPEMEGAAVSGHMSHAAAAPSPGQSGSQNHQQSHQAHCLFCLTGAFALEAETATPLNVPVVYQATVAPEMMQARAAAPRHADARAPPQRGPI